MEAFDYLKGQGLIDFEKPMAHFYEPIKNYLASKYPDRAGQYKNMDEEPIRKAIRPFFRKNPQKTDL